MYWLASRSAPDDIRRVHELLRARAAEVAPDDAAGDSRPTGPPGPPG
jgi:hypothetical protein